MLRTDYTAKTQEFFAQQKRQKRFGQLNADMQKMMKNMFHGKPPGKFEHLTGSKDDYIPSMDEITA